MSDNLTKEKRSKVMRSIHGKDTSIERMLRSELFSRGYRFRKNVTSMSGKPDIVLPKYKTVIFVHGCFWHHHKGCSIANTPRTRTKFWKDKFIKNMKRDQDAANGLITEGWNVFIVWECEILHNVKVVVDEIEKLMKIMDSMSKRLLLEGFGCFVKK